MKRRSKQAAEKLENYVFSFGVTPSTSPAPVCEKKEGDTLTEPNEIKRIRTSVDTLVNIVPSTIMQQHLQLLDEHSKIKTYQKLEKQNNKLKMKLQSCPVGPRVYNQSKKRKAQTRMKRKLREQKMKDEINQVKKDLQRYHSQKTEHKVALDAKTKSPKVH